MSRPTFEQMSETDIAIGFVTRKLFQKFPGYNGEIKTDIVGTNEWRMMQFPERVSKLYWNTLEMFLEIKF
jgi:hypothetical protein